LVSLTKWLIYGLVGAFALSSLIDPARAQGTVGAFSGIGGVLGNLGAGLKSLGQGAGSGAAGLLNPLWTLRDLIYGPQAGAQTQKDMYEITATGNTANTQQEIQQQENVQNQFQSLGSFPTQTTPQPQEGMTPAYSLQGSTEGAAGAANLAMQGFSYHSVPGLNPTPVTSALVHGQNVPLSAAAVQYYQSIGVDVSPANNETIAANNSANATSPGASAQSSNYSAGAAQAAGYSTGNPQGSNN
tara:strand:+ start:53 stop:781 length:729 start_codon:yes stop_codon:yes gene_type:complete